MCSYNAVNGVPSCANDKFINGVLRGNWSWDGHVVSDCGAIGDIYSPHRYTKTHEDTVAAALHGGTDLECDSYYKKYLPSALQQGKVSTADLDRSVTRVLQAFVELGELEGPDDVPYQRYGAEMVDTTAHRLLSLSVAEQAMTLLKNDPARGGTLPLLPLAKGAKVALVGPQANFTLEMLSNYEGQNKLVLGHSTLMAAQKAGLSVSYAAGHSLDVSSTDTSLIPGAVAAATAADVAVVMVGLCADHCAGHGRTENEGNDRGPRGSGWHTLGLPGAQEQLLEAVVAAQPRTVLVMMNGGMFSIGWAKANVPAILEAYYPGQLGGDAVVNTLLGKNNPGGKTPVTWYPDSILSRPITDMDLTSRDGLTHLYYKGDALWPFGWGLSYTTFAYAWPAAAAARAELSVAAAARGTAYSCTVRNTGAAAGDAVVLGFANSSDPQFPRQKLFDFDRVRLAPGEATTVRLAAPAGAFSVVDDAGARWLRPARVAVRVGDVVAPAVRAFELTGGALLLEDYAAAL